MDTWDSGERYSFVVRTPEKFNRGGRGGLGVDVPGAVIRGGRHLEEVVPRAGVEWTGW